MRLPRDVNLHNNELGKNELPESHSYFLNSLLSSECLVSWLVCGCQLSADLLWGRNSGWRIGVAG